jgi:SAM-dependent methyltransferase
MFRTQIIQRILNKRTSARYLEIGVDSGINFFSIKAGRKIAVDPKFNFSRMDRIRWLFKNRSNLFARFYNGTSDSFFADTKTICQFDVVFIDGLHTYEQSLKDLNNALNHLKPNGVIIMHDCDPPNETAALPADSYEHVASLNLSGWKGWWSGDVWKVICHLRSTREDLKIFVLDCDSGLGVITRGEPDSRLSLSPEEIKNMTFKEFSRDRVELLNLRNKEYFLEFLKNT